MLHCHLQLLVVVPVNRLHMIFYMYFIVTMSLSCTILQILTFSCQNQTPNQTKVKVTTYLGTPNRVTIKKSKLPS